MSCIANSNSKRGAQGADDSCHRHWRWPRRRGSETDRPRPDRAADTRARCLARNVGALSPLRAHAGAGGEPHPLRRSCRRFRAWHRRRFARRVLARRASMFRPSCKRSIAIPMAVQSRSSAAPCASLREQTGQDSAWNRSRYRSAYTRRDRTRAGTPGLESAPSRLVGDDADNMWLHAFVTDFLTRRAGNKFDVPQKKFDAALERLRNLIANASDIGAGQGAPIAYAAYVLAAMAARSWVICAISPMQSSTLSRARSPNVRISSAALANWLGDRPRAEGGFYEKAVGGSARSAIAIFGCRLWSRLRDGAASSRLPSRRKCLPRD